MRRFLGIVAGAVLLGSGGGTLRAQDIHFSQFYENAILRNPGLTGIFSGDYKVGVNYRSQWSDISVPFQTTLVSAETRLVTNRDIGDYLSFGLSAAYDHAGTIDFNSFYIYPAICYNKALEDRHASYLSVGLAGGYIQRSVDQSKMTFTSQYVGGSYSQSNPSGENLPFKSITNYDVSAGVSLNSSIGQNNKFNYYLGAAVYHVSQPSQSFVGDQEFIKLGMKWEGNLGFRYSFTPQYGLTVHVNYTNQNPYQEWIGGGLLSWRNIPSEVNPKNFVLYVGLFYRNKDAIIPTVKLDYQMYSLTFSYDVNNSTLRPATGGSGGTEISLFVRGKYKKGRFATDLTKCPQFEQMPESAFQSH